VPFIDDEALLERYFERCAIMEFDGELTRLEATSHCFGRLEKWCKNQGRTIPGEAIQDLQTVEKEIQRGS